MGAIAAGVVAGGALIGTGLALNPGGGDAAKVRGFSTNVNERQQRLQESLAQLSARNQADQQALSNYFIEGGPWQQGEIYVGGVGTHKGNFEQLPDGNLFYLVNNGLQGEVDNSALRQQIAQQQLGATPLNMQAQQGFDLNALMQGTGALSGQASLLSQLSGQSGGSLDFTNQLQGGLGDFFSSGGAPSQAQQQQIGSIFDAQRNIGNSNLQQQFGNSLQQLQDHATTRGLRFGDTPIQDRGGLLAQEFARNTTNLESSLGGQQANALLQQPFQQAQLGGSLLGQGQNNLLNLFNSYSAPIGQGFNSGQSLQNQNQFGLQFTPSSTAGPAIQNTQSFLQNSNPAPNNPVFTGGNVIAQNPDFIDTFSQGFAGSSGSGLGSAAASGFGAGASHPSLKEGIEVYHDEAGLEAIRGVPVYSWRYKGEDQSHIGGMTTDMPDEVIIGDVETRQSYDIVSYLGLLTAALRALDAEVKVLKGGA